MSLPQLRLIRTMWGILDFQKHDIASWEPLFVKLKGMGYAGIEYCVGPFNCFASDKEQAKRLLAKHGLVSVCQIHTCGYPIASFNVDAHVRSFLELSAEAVEMGAVLVNLHSGCDAWSANDAAAFFERMAEVEKQRAFPFPIVHETHRRRALYGPWAARDAIARVPSIQLNADLSHWVCVCERLLDDPCDADWGWPALLQALAQRVRLIHARVGYAHGPQVPDPSAPEYANEWRAHVAWWSELARGAAARHLEHLYVEPEFGPPPYLHTLPHTNVPVADLWRVNTWVGEQLRDHLLKLNLVRL